MDVHGLQFRFTDATTPKVAVESSTDPAMTANTNANRFSSYTNASTGSDAKNGGEQKKDMWSTLLDSVASGKRLLEKNLLVLGALCPDVEGF